MAFLVLVGGAYLFKRHTNRILLTAMTMGFGGIYLFFHLHPALDWIPGGWTAWRSTYTVAIVGFVVYLWVRRKGANPDATVWKWAMFLVGLAAFFTFALGGFVRERARQPYNVYDELVKVEVLPHEADRWLVYTKCIGCHFQSPGDLDRFARIDWKERVQIERERPGLELTDEEAERIATYLKEFYR